MRHSRSRAIGPFRSPVQHASRLLLLFLLAAGSSGCEQWNAPERVRKLEGRVDELSAEVSALKREAPGAEQSHAAAPSDHAPAAAHEGPAASTHLTAPAAQAPSSDAHGAAAAAHPAEKAAHPHWGYEGAEGPAAWGKLSPEWASCGAGKSQSPIDIEPKNGRASPIEFHYRPTAATIVDNGHTLQVNFAPGSSIAIEGHAYQLLQFHVHTPSEHTIAGERYPMELHLVHKDDAGKLAVVGVLYDLGAASQALGTVWARWPRKVGAEDKLPKPIDPVALLPETRSLYRYSGSLTTPPCTEGVVWNVLRRTMTDSKTNLDILRLHYPVNARPVLPRGARDVL
jgi:carbonic anhydrase